jgi:hypothetical protein
MVLDEFNGEISTIYNKKISNERDTMGLHDKHDLYEKINSVADEMEPQINYQIDPKAVPEIQKAQEDLNKAKVEDTKTTTKRSGLFGLLSMATKKKDKKEENKEDDEPKHVSRLGLFRQIFDDPRSILADHCKPALKIYDMAYEANRVLERKVVEYGKKFQETFSGMTSEESERVHSLILEANAHHRDPIQVISLSDKYHIAAKFGDFIEAYEASIDADAKAVQLKQSKEYADVHKFYDTKSGKTIVVGVKDKNRIFEVKQKAEEYANKNMNNAISEIVNSGEKKYTPEQMKSIIDHYLGYRKMMDSLGIILYQEQIMQIAQKFCGYTLGEADNLIRIIGRKKVDEMTPVINDMIQRGVKNGYEEQTMKKLTDNIVTFALYGFNRGHSAAYGMTAWLKAHYTGEFMASVIDSNCKDKPKMAQYVLHAMELGVEILPPILRHRNCYSSYDEDGPYVILGLNCISGVGNSEIPKDAPEDFHEFMKQYENMNKTVLKNLVKAGYLKVIVTKCYSILIGLRILGSQKGNSNTILQTIITQRMSLPS